MNTNGHESAVCRRWFAPGGFLAIALLLGGAAEAGTDVATNMVGRWEGSGRIIVTWCRQTNLAVRLDICADGSVTGAVGNAQLKEARFKRNRGWFGRKLKVKTDYIVTGKLQGDIVAAEGIHRSGVMIPLNFTTNAFTGGLHTSGSHLGGKQHMKLSVARLVLSRTNSPAPDTRSTPPAR